jgi:hypothetical protein
LETILDTSESADWRNQKIAIHPVVPKEFVQRHIKPQSIHQNQPIKTPLPEKCRGVFL